MPVRLDLAKLALEKRRLAKAIRESLPLNPPILQESLVKMANAEDAAATLLETSGSQITIQESPEEQPRSSA